MIPGLADPSLFESLKGLIRDYPDVAVIALLILCGAGLPVPEEPILLVAGWVAHELSSGESADKGLQLMRMALDCTVGILLGDLLCFYLGRTFGPSILGTRFMKRIATPARQERAHRWFEDYGAWSIFIARFFAGVRIVMYFTAGMSRRVSYLKFVFMDFLGVLVSVPVSVWVGYKIAQELSDWEKARQKLGHFHMLLLAALAVGLVVWFFIARRKKAVEKGVAPPPPAPPPGDAGP